MAESERFQVTIKGEGVRIEKAVEGWIAAEVARYAFEQQTSSDQRRAKREERTA